MFSVYAKLGMYNTTIILKIRKFTILRNLSAFNTLCCLSFDIYQGNVNEIFTQLIPDSRYLYIFEFKIFP